MLYPETIAGSIAKDKTVFDTAKRKMNTEDFQIFYITGVFLDEFI